MKYLIDIIQNQPLLIIFFAIVWAWWMARKEQK